MTGGRDDPSHDTGDHEWFDCCSLAEEKFDEPGDGRIMEGEKFDCADWHCGSSVCGGSVGYKIADDDAVSYSRFGRKNLLWYWRSEV